MLYRVFYYSTSFSLFSKCLQLFFPTYFFYLFFYHCVESDRQPFSYVLHPLPISSQRFLRPQTKDFRAFAPAHLHRETQREGL